MNSKTYTVLILLMILVFAASGCSKAESDQTVSEQPSSTTEKVTEEVPNTGKVEIESDQTVSEQPSSTAEEPTEEVPDTDKVETETVLGDDGSISITSRDSAGNVVAQIHYDASTDITEKYIYEYDEQGNLLHGFNYVADGNVADKFAANNYEDSYIERELHYDVSDNDTDNPFEVTIEELAPLYHKAEEIWDRYGVVVLIADKVSDTTEGAELCFEYGRIQSGLDLIESCLDCYHENFFREFSGDVCIQLVGAGYASGVYMGGNEHLLLQIDVNCYSPSDEYDDEGNFFCYTLHHEIYHMINEQLLERASDSECPLSEEQWNSYNPEGFEYVNGYDDEKEAEIYCSDNNFEYFIDSYGCSTSNEDRATIFGEAMAYYQGYERIKLTDQVNAKLKYLSDCIRAGFQSDGWEEIAPWEYMLNR